MKAIIFEQYGSPDVLQFKDVPKPTPEADEVLVKVEAAGANPADWRRMRANPFLVRLSDGLSKPKDNRLGADIAGMVEAVGSNVSKFQVGDAVFGEIGKGGFAEYVAVSETLLVAKPKTLSFVEAASIPVVGFTALQGLHDSGKMQASDHVVINGASGGIGTFAVQYAKAMGAEVTGVCSGRNVELVRSLGADHVIDYTQEDFTKNGQQYDLIYDAVGNLSVADMQRALTPNGRGVVAGMTTLGRLFQVMIVGAWVSRFGEQDIGSMGSAVPKEDDLLTIKELLESGQVRAVIDQCYPLSDTADALRYLETGRTRGKVVITIGDGISKGK